MEDTKFNGISPKKLVECIEAKKNVMIIDCRSNIEFETSHISGSCNLGGSRASRRDIINNRVDVLQTILTSAVFMNIQSYDLSNWIIIVYDQCSPSPSAIHNQSLLFSVALTLQTKFPLLSILEGGFIGFQSLYPSYCWVSSRKMPDEDFVTPSSRPSVHDSTSLPGPSSSSTILTRSATTLTLSPPPLTPIHINTKDPSPLRLTLSNPALSTSDIGPTPVLPHLYLGSQQDAIDPHRLRQHHITHLINVSTNAPQSPFISSSNFLRIPILDNFSDKITTHFPVAFQFLDRVQKEGGRVLVHCSAGISRSPTLAIAYLMKTQAMSVQQAYEFVKASRPSVSPNFNFMGQLTNYETELREQKPSRPKKRPSRLGILSNILLKAASPHRFIKSSKRSSLVATTSSASLLPSPSTPFAKLGLNSPMTEDSAPQLIDSFPSTSLERLTFRPCLAGLPRTLKTKRPAAVTNEGQEGCKVKRRADESDMKRYQERWMSSTSLCGNNNNDNDAGRPDNYSHQYYCCQQPEELMKSTELDQKHRSSLSGLEMLEDRQPQPIPSSAATTNQYPYPPSTTATALLADPGNSQMRSTASSPTAPPHLTRRSASYDKLDSAVRCRLQESNQQHHSHQRHSTSSLSSNNSHSSSLLV